MLDSAFLTACREKHNEIIKYFIFDWKIKEVGTVKIVIEDPKLAFVKELFDKRTNLGNLNDELRQKLVINESVPNKKLKM